MIDEAVLAATILAARSTGVVVPAPVEHGLDPAAAYRVQAAVDAGRWESSRVGWKLGYTSQAMRAQMGIAEPNFGPLHAGMLLASGAVLAGGVVQPRIEPELAAVIGADIAHPAQVDTAVREWRAALEVVDSVWADYRFDWELNTADGSSAAYVVVGPRVPIASAGELVDLAVRLYVDDVEVERGTGAAAMGDPHAAVRWLVDRLAQRGEVLRAGDVVITGGLTRAVPFAVGSAVRAEVGPVVVSVSRVADHPRLPTGCREVG